METIFFMLRGLNKRLGFDPKFEYTPEITMNNLKTLSTVY